MVGWSRRSRESSERRERFYRWYGSLSEKEKADYEEREAARRAREMKIANKGFAVFGFVLLLYSIFVYWWAHK